MRSQPLRSTCTLMPGCAASNALAIFSAVCNSIEVYQTIVPSAFALASRSGLAAVGSGARGEGRTGDQPDQQQGDGCGEIASLRSQ